MGAAHIFFESPFFPFCLMVEPIMRPYFFLSPFSEKIKIMGKNMHQYIKG